MTPAWQDLSNGDGLGDGGGLSVLVSAVSCRWRLEFPISKNHSVMYSDLRRVA